MLVEITILDMKVVLKMNNNALLYQLPSPQEIGNHYCDIILYSV